MDFEQFIVSAKKLHSEYVSRVSDLKVAISWDSLLFVLKQIHSFKGCSPSVLDLGTGISSVLFRAYKESFKPDAKIISVDTSAGWLLAASNYIIEKELPVNYLITWPNFLGIKFVEDYYDFILFDIADTSFNRIHYIKPVFKRYIGPDTVLFLDDFHKAHLQRAFFRNLNDYFDNFELTVLKDETLDEFGRFMAVVKSFESKTPASDCSS